MAHEIPYPDPKVDLDYHDFRQVVDLLFGGDKGLFNERELNILTRYLMRQTEDRFYQKIDSLPQKIRFFFIWAGPAISFKVKEIGMNSNTRSSQKHINHISKQADIKMERLMDEIETDRQTISTCPNLLQQYKQDELKFNEWAQDALGKNLPEKIAFLSKNLTSVSINVLNLFGKVAEFTGNRVTTAAIVVGRAIQDHLKQSIENRQQKIMHK
jgi:hypothetical protein